mmetsp:Transcript_25147/g.72724  ORF Transcript_25147/g.72724 Transcript_25147/m.72724 type:complete len:146 (-) Transcript_25147:153-590(-)
MLTGRLLFTVVLLPSINTLLKSIVPSSNNTDSVGLIPAARRAFRSAFLNIDDDETNDATVRPTDEERPKLSHEDTMSCSVAFTSPDLVSLSPFVAIRSVVPPPEKYSSLDAMSCGRSSDDASFDLSVFVQIAHISPASFLISVDL